MPPVRLSASEDPVNVVAAPVLVTLYPFVPAVTAPKLTEKPLVLISITPLLDVALVAVHEAKTVAFAIAPLSTVNISEPRPKSVIVSVPPLRMNLSSPS